MFRPMKKQTLMALVFLLFCSLSTFLQYAYAEEEVPIPSLTIKPEEYHGKRITVTGYVSLAFEGQCVSAYEPLEDRFIYKDAVWLDSEIWSLSEVSVYEVHFNLCTLTGVYDMHAKGHFGGFSGTLRVEAIECMEREYYMAPF